MRVIPGRGCVCGVVGHDRQQATDCWEIACCVSGSGLEWSTVVGESPVRESMMVFFDCVPE